MSFQFLIGRTLEPLIINSDEKCESGEQMKKSTSLEKPVDREEELENASRGHKDNIDLQEKDSCRVDR